MLFNKTISSLEALAEAGLVREITASLREVVARYPVQLTAQVAGLIDGQDSCDPIAAQFVPSEAELVRKPSELSDPIGDAAHSPLEGLVHRYPDRALIKITKACFAQCRFCFRRDMTDEVLDEAALEKIFTYIENHPDIWEVILSGGDPLTLSDRRLEDIVKRVNNIASIKVLRLHTRAPVVAAERITPTLIQVLKGRVPVYVFLHANHAREMNAAACAACATLVEAGIPVLSQSVLLRGVNDSHEALAALMRAFVEARVIPHYLHVADLAPGTSHFRVPLARAQALHAGLRGVCSGLAQPRLILDIPGGAGKMCVEAACLKKEKKGWSVTDYKGEQHYYEDDDDLVKVV